MRPSRLMYGLATALREKRRGEEALRSYYWGSAAAPLYPEAALAGGPAELVAYGRFCRAARRAAEEHYRMQAIGLPAPLSLEASVLAEAERTLDIKTTAELQASLGRRYLSEYERVRDACVSAHEIRHMIDAQSSDSPDTEFGARLSAAIFSDVPAACLLDVIAHNIGQQDSHGQANEKITRGTVAWIAAHSDEIKGVDRSRPLLPQFDLLSDDQIRAALRSMDPLAAKK